MKFLRQNFVPDVAAIPPSLFHGLSAGGAGFASSPPPLTVGEPPHKAGETDDSSGISRFR
jgi:hypothetical protein